VTWRTLISLSFCHRYRHLSRSG